MSVNYDLYETPDLAKSGEEQPLHARVVLKGSYTAEEFVEQVTVFQHMPHAQSGRRYRSYIKRTTSFAFERIFGRAGRYRLFLPFIEC